MSKAVIRKEMLHLQVCEDIQNKTNKPGISVESGGVFHVILS